MFKIFKIFLNSNSNNKIKLKKMIGQMLDFKEASLKYGDVIMIKSEDIENPFETTYLCCFG